MANGHTPLVAGNPPSPNGGWSTEICTLSDATVFPPVVSSMVQACGVQESDGSYCLQSATWRGGRQTMIASASPVEPVETLKGRYLFAGQLWYHFGHYMVESLSRLWALDHLDEKPDGIIFIPKRPGGRPALIGYKKSFWTFWASTFR